VPVEMVVSFEIVMEAESLLCTTIFIDASCYKIVDSQTLRYAQESEILKVGIGHCTSDFATLLPNASYTRGLKEFLKYSDIFKVAIMIASLDTVTSVFRPSCAHLAMYNGWFN